METTYDIDYWIAQAEEKWRPSYPRRYMHSLLASSYWTCVRNAILLRDGSKCKRCGCVNTDENLLHIHHKTYSHSGREHLYLDDLEVMCCTCHYTVGKEEKKLRLRKNPFDIPKTPPSSKLHSLMRDSKGRLPMYSNARPPREWA